jgi:hypothetical protein
VPAEHKFLDGETPHCNASWITKVITDAPTGCVKNHSWLLVGKASATRTLSVIFQDRFRNGDGRKKRVRLGSAEQAE